MNDKLPKTSESEEVDLGQLFKLIGSAFERFFNFIGGILNKLFLGFVWMIFFVKKHALKIALAGVIGFGIAFANEKISGPTFVSSVTVRQNYNTGENLYDLVNYYNSLMKEEGSSAHRQILGIENLKELNIMSFEIEPIVSENVRVKNFDDYLRGLDSVLASTIDYETYLENTMNYDYDYQKISIKTKQSSDLLPVFNNIIDRINSAQYFKSIQSRDLEELTNRELALKQGLVESDSLKNTYKRVLEQTIDKPKGSQTSITIEGANRIKETKEFQLYQNDLDLRRELVVIERRKQNLENIIEIVSSEFTSGVVDDTIKVLGKRLSIKIFYIMFFALIAFLALLGIEFFKYLEKHKSTL